MESVYLLYLFLYSPTSSGLCQLLKVLVISRGYNMTVTIKLDG